MEKRPTADETNGHNGGVQLAREEYDALMAREETHAQLEADHARLTNRLADQTMTINAQCRRMSEMDQRVTALEQLLALRREVVTEFGTEITVSIVRPKSTPSDKMHEPSASKVVKALSAIADVAEIRLFEPVTRETISWVARVAGGDDGPKTARQFQEHYIRELREDNAKLTAMIKAEREELEQLRAAHAKQQPHQDKEKKQP